MPMILAPKLRSDLTVSRQQTGGRISFIIKDPIAGTFFHLREAEAFIAQQFDGATTLEAVRQRTEEKFEAALAPEVLTSFVKSLENGRLLDTGETAEPAEKAKPAGRQSRVSGSLLYLRFKAFDPSWLFERLIGRVRFFFTRAFLIFSAFVIAVAVAVAAANWTQYRQELPRLYHFSVVGIFMLLSFLVVTAHEFGHGLTCKYFGGDVREIGFMLVYFQPALYCNVSDAWLFPEKSKRLWVGFAGPYFELFLWALATLTWRITDTESWVNLPALIVMTTSGIKTLMNFNPFIKLDGYYLLSDYLEIPNLRRKAFRYVGRLVQRALGLGSPETQEVPPRERRVFLLYGLIATVSSFCLLAYVLYRAAALVVESRHPTAFLVSLFLLGSKLRRRLRRLFGGKADRDDPLDDGGASGSVATPSSHKVTGSKERRHSGRWRRRIFYVLVLGIAAAAVVAIQRGHMELRVAGPFSILPRENADVRATVEGIIDRIYVDEGDQVKRGDLVARLSDKDLRAELQKVEAEIRQTGARLRMQEAGPTSYELDVAKTVVTKAEDNVKYARERLARIGQLYEEHLRSRNMYEDTKGAANAAEDELLEARSRLNLLLSGSRPEQLEATTAQIESLNSTRAYLLEQLRQLTILSPATGIVATPSRQLKEMRHVLVKKGDLILKVYDTRAVTAQILISEREIDAVAIGQPVVLRTRAYPDYEFQGTVRSIATSALGGSANSPETTGTAAPSSSSTNVNRIFIVTTEIQNDAMLLKSEMTGHAKISCGRRRIVELIRRRLGRTLKVEFWSWW
jgi:putative peptide zinc metalloprotease protein